MINLGRFMHWKPQCEPHRQAHRFEPQREQLARGFGDGGAVSAGWIWLDLLGGFNMVYYG